jgi:hypothetical protein
MEAENIGTAKPIPYGISYFEYKRVTDSFVHFALKIVIW